jgi:hypothetical protein
MGRMPFCEKESSRIDEDSENPINPALVGFPEWCPLETAVISEGQNTDYKREVKQIMRIIDNASPDAFQEASHYLNSVIENAKKKAKED